MHWISAKVKGDRPYVPTFQQVNAAEFGTDAVWEALSGRGLGSGTSLLVIRRAETLSASLPGWRDLPGLIERLRTGMLLDRYVVFVSSQQDTWQRDGAGKLMLDEQGKKQPYPHVARIQKSTMCDVITCSTLSAVPKRNKYGTPTGLSDAVLWLQSYAPIGEKEAEYLIKKVGGDLYSMKNVVQKAAVFDRSPTIGVIDILVGGGTSHASSSFTEHLIANQKPEALAYVAEHPQWDSAALRAELRALDRALDALGVLHTARRNHATRAQAMRSTSESASMNVRERSRLTNWDVERFWEFAETYDLRRRAQCRIVLGVISACMDSDHGAVPLGLSEALVSQW